MATEHLEGGIVTHNVAIIGYGTQGDYHTRNINSDDTIDMTVIGEYDTDPAADEDAIAAGLRVYSTFEEILEDDDIDAVFICTPNDSHRPYALRALQAGKNVMVEKPAMMNSAEMEEVVAAANASERAVIVHQNRRWDPDFLVIKDIYDNKTIGEPTYLESRVHGSRGIPGDWRHRLNNGGGMVLDWGVHCVDRVLMMVNSPVVDVFGKLSYALGHDVDDGFRAYLTFANGFQAFFDVSTTAYIPEPLFFMQSDKGTVVVEDWALNGSIIVRTGAEEDDATPIQAGVGLTKTMAPRIMDWDLYAEMAPPVAKLELPEIVSDVSEFYHNAAGVLDGTAQPLIENRDVIRCLRILEAVVESSRTHRIVHPETADTPVH